MPRYTLTLTDTQHDPVPVTFDATLTRLRREDPSRVGNPALRWRVSINLWGQGHFRVSAPTQQNAKAITQQSMDQLHRTGHLAELEAMALEAAALPASEVETYRETVSLTKGR